MDKTAADTVAGSINDTGSFVYRVSTTATNSTLDFAAIPVRGRVTGRLGVQWSG